MSLFVICFVIIITLAFWMGMHIGSAKKEKEYKDIVEMIFQRRYIVQERNLDPDEEFEYEFKIQKKENVIKPVFSD